jgi:hypothetical protein
MQPLVRLAPALLPFFMIIIVILPPRARIRCPGVDRNDEEFIMMIIRDRSRSKPAGA